LREKDLDYPINAGILHGAPQLRERDLLKASSKNRGLAQTPHSVYEGGALIIL
jgi:hypothetical protein